MSGQIVGEVMDAAEAGHLDALSSNGLQALVAIADRAANATRQASVRMARVAAAIRVDRRAGGSGAASQSTAERAVRELKAGGWIRVVKRGFNNNHGRACAPIYEVAAFPSFRVTGTVAGVPVTQGDGNGGGSVSVNEGSVSVKVASVSVTQGDDLTVFLDGSTDGSACAREDEPAPADRVEYRDDPPEDQPGPFGDAAAATAAPPARHWVMGPHGPRCADHVDNPSPPKCGGCGRAREAAKAQAEAEATAIAAEKAAIRAEINACTSCDHNGMTHGDEPRRCTEHRQQSDVGRAS